MTIAACVVLLAGCGGQKALPSHAGMNEWEARERAMEAMGRELRSRSSPLHGHKVELRVLRMGKNSSGRAAWVAHFVDRTDKTEACLRMWAMTALNIRSYEGEWTDCDLDVDPPDASLPPEDEDAPA